MEIPPFVVDAKKKSRTISKGDSLDLSYTLRLSKY